MPDNYTNIDYGSRTYQGIKTSIISFLQTEYPNDWNSFIETDLGVSLVEIVAYAAAGMHYYIDFQGNETFLSTVKDRQNLINLLKLIGYKMDPPDAASTFVTVSIPQALSYDVTVPIGTVVKAGSVVFEFMEDAVITAGLTEVREITVTQGETKTETFEGTGRPFQIFYGSYNPMIKDSSSAVIGSNNWTQVDSILTYSTDDVFTVELDKDDYPIFKFGDGVAGNIPSLGVPIVFTYRVGGGLEGNISANAINTTVEGTSIAGTVTVSVNNPDRAIGGEERETAEEARIFGPRFVKTHDTLVTQEDYETLVENYPGIAYAGIQLDSPEGLSNLIDIYLWTSSTSAIEVSATGDGSTVDFSYTLTNASTTYPIIGSSIDITYYYELAGNLLTATITDDGSGNLVGDVNSAEATVDIDSALTVGYATLTIESSSSVSGYKGNNVDVEVLNTAGTSFDIKFTNNNASPVTSDTIVGTSFATLVTDLADVTNFPNIGEVICSATVSGTTENGLDATYSFSGGAGPNTVNYITGAVEFTTLYTPYNLTYIESEYTMSIERITPLEPRYSSAIIYYPVESVPLDPLVNSLSDYLEERKMVSVEHVFNAGVIQLEDIVVSVKVLTGYFFSDVQNSVTEALQEQFSPTRFSPGESLKISEIYDTVRNLSGVDYCYIIDPTDPDYSSPTVFADNVDVDTDTVIVVNTITVREIS